MMAGDRQRWGVKVRRCRVMLGIFEFARQDDPSAEDSQGYPSEDADVADKDPVRGADEE